MTEVRMPSRPVQPLPVTRTYSEPVRSSRCPHRNYRRHHHHHQTSTVPQTSPIFQELMNDNSDGFSNKSCLQQMIQLIFRFVPILIAAMGIICLLTFLFNNRIAYAVFNITLVIICSIIIFFVSYAMIMFYLFRRYSINNVRQQQRRQLELQRQRQQQQRSPRHSHHQHCCQHGHRRHSWTDPDNLIFTMPPSMHISYHDDDDNECYDCRMQRLKITDIPPAYESPPKYEELENIHPERLTIIEEEPIINNNNNQDTNIQIEELNVSALDTRQSSY